MRRILILFARAAAVLLVVVAGGAGLLIWHLGPAPFETANQVSRLVLDRNGQLLRAYTTADGRWRLPATSADVDARYLALLFAFEDRRFYDHGGVDFRAIGRAVLTALQHGRLISGASTLTMQTARLLDGTPTHSALSKAKQVIRAWELERSLSKAEILETYLRLAPYGGNIEGVRAASLAWFAKEPKRLALHEAALLVALPQSPEVRRPDRNPAAAKRARDLVLTRAAELGVIKPGEAEWAKSQPIPLIKQDFPALSAHLADRLSTEYLQEKVIRTTIDKAQQQAAEALAARHAASLGPKLSTAIIAADHQTGEIISIAGSAGYFDDSRQGAIDMTRALRSPGSALKPFVYGLAFEDGFAHPQTLIDDRPVYFGTYAPQNFDNTFRGTITVAQALQWSLNVPAVKLLAAITPARLASRFRHAGFRGEIPQNLSVVLGGAGMTLEDLTGLYAAVARGGQPVDFKYLNAPPDLGSASSADRSPLLAPLAAWYVTDILRGSPPPPNAPAGIIAFKTGTSYGYRDAWAVGYSGRYIVAAWAGRPDNSSTPGLMGLSAAAPMVFDMFARLSPARAPFAPPPSSALTGPTAALPVPLQRFREPGQAATETASASQLRIAFPPDNAELELSQTADGKTLPVVLKAEGGALPLTWLVDGAPLSATDHRREVMWTPAGKGFTQLMVLDAAGATRKARIRVR